MQTIYFAGGCLWGVQAFTKTLPGVIATEAGRANGASDSLGDPTTGTPSAPGRRSTRIA